MSTMWNPDRNCWDVPVIRGYAAGMHSSQPRRGPLGIPPRRGRPCDDADRRHHPRLEHRTITDTHVRTHHERRGQGRSPGAAGIHGPARPGPHRGLSPPSPNAWGTRRHPSRAGGVLVSCRLADRACRWRPMTSTRATAPVRPSALLTGSRPSPASSWSNVPRPALRARHRILRLPGYQAARSVASTRCCSVCRMCCARTRFTSSPAWNEELAATSVWGSQIELPGGFTGRDGVVGVWVRQGPQGRPGHALRHAQPCMACTRAGVVLSSGTTRPAKSSTARRERTLVGGLGIRSCCPATPKRSSPSACTPSRSRGPVARRWRSRSSPTSPTAPGSSTTPSRRWSR